MVAALVIIGTLDAAHAGDAPAQVAQAKKECTAEVDAKGAAVVQMLRASDWSRELGDVHVGDDGNYVCMAFVSATVFESKVKEIWSVSAPLGKPAAADLDGRFYGEDVKVLLSGKLRCADLIARGSVAVVRVMPDEVVRIDLPRGVQAAGVDAGAGTSIYYKGAETEFPMSYPTNEGRIEVCAVRAKEGDAVDRHVVLTRRHQ